MLNRLLLSLGLIDEAIHPFHRMMAAVTFVGTLSVQAVVTAYLEPVKMIWYSFVLTFPLTTGLTILFLLVYNFNWKKAGLADLFTGAGLFALLFLTLNGLYAVLGLDQVARKYEAQELREQQVRHYRDSLEDPARFQQIYLLQQRTKDSVWKAHHPSPASITSNNSYENVKKFAADNGDFTTAAPTRPWYRSIVSYLVIPFAFLWTQLRDFYRDYGVARFWSGVVLSFCFSIYINLLKQKLKNRSSGSAGE